MLEANKNSATVFYEMAFLGKPREAVEQYVGDRYITYQIWPDGEEYVTMDFFRFDSSGKLVEHWDSIQQIPESTASGNTMY